MKAFGKLEIDDGDYQAFTDAMNHTAYAASGRQPYLEDYMHPVDEHMGVENQRIVKLNLREQKIESIPESLLNLGGLRILNLSNNMISSVSEEIRRLQELEELYLEGNRFSEFPKAVTGMKRLRVLHIGRNWLTELPDSIGLLENLERLDLFMARLTELPEAICSLKKLEYLNVCDNELTSVPDCIMRMENLKQLDVSGNDGISRALKERLREAFREAVEV